MKNLSSSKHTQSALSCSFDMSHYFTSSSSSSSFIIEDIFFTRRVVVEREVLHKMRDNCWVSDVYLLIFIMSNFSNGFMSPLCEIFQLYTHLCGTHQTRFYYSYNVTMQVFKIASIKILQSFFHSHYKQRMKRQKYNYLQFFLMINFKKKSL